MTRYEITGRTATMFTQHAVGEIVELDLDDDTETLLRDAGAIRELPAAKKEPPAKKTTTAASRATK